VADKQKEAAAKEHLTRLGVAVYKNAHQPDSSDGRAAVLEAARAALPGARLKRIKARAKKHPDVEGLSELVAQAARDIEQASSLDGWAAHRLVVWALAAMDRTLDLADTEGYIAPLRSHAGSQLGRSEGGRAAARARAKLPAHEVLVAEKTAMVNAGKSERDATSAMVSKYVATANCTAHAVRAKLKKKKAR